MADVLDWDEGVLMGDGVCAVVSGVLKQVWDLSDQDNDSMLSLREFCTALYFMERFREGRALPSTLPGGIHPADSSQGPAGGAGQGPGGQSGAVWRHIPGLAICEALGDGGVQWGGVLSRCLGLKGGGYLTLCFAMASRWSADGSGWHGDGSRWPGGSAPVPAAADA
jgi:hypothetical protein